MPTATSCGRRWCRGPRHLVAVKGECHAELDVAPQDGQDLADRARMPAPPKPSILTATRPLVGPLRVQNKLFRDDTGYRRVFFASWFTALRTLRDNPTEFDRQLDAIVAAGYQGFRVFLAVGGWSDYWDNHEVLPVGFQKWFYTGNLQRSDRLGAQLTAWPDYDDLLRTLFRKVRARGLRLDVTGGDYQIIFGNDQAKELALARRVAAIAAEEGGTDVIALVEGTNEFPINRYGSDSDASVEQLGRVLDIWRKAIPGVLTTEGAVISEEPEKLLLGARYGQVAAVHVSRDPIELLSKADIRARSMGGQLALLPGAVLAHRTARTRQGFVRRAERSGEPDRAVCDARAAGPRRRTISTVRPCAAMVRSNRRGVSASCRRSSPCCRKTSRHGTTRATAAAASCISSTASSSRRRRSRRGTRHRRVRSRIGRSTPATSVTSRHR
jgi:hypothetical protein